MDKEFMEMKGFKSWYEDLDNHNIMLSDDIDSLASFKFLQSMFNVEVDIFNDFGNMYFNSNKDIHSFKKNKMVGLDIDLKNNKCISNHVTFIDNKDCISLNRGIDVTCYTKKFAGSTLLTVMSLYNYNISNYTKEQLEVLISVDTAFKQYYFNKDLFKHYYATVLQYSKFIDIVHDKKKDYFYNIIKKYKLHEKIYINEDGYLETKIELEQLSKLFNIDLSLPTQKFNHFYGFEVGGLPLEQFKREVDKEKIFSNAIVNSNFVVASLK